MEPPRRSDDNNNNNNNNNDMSLSLLSSSLLSLPPPVQYLADDNDDDDDDDNNDNDNDNDTVELRFSEMLSSSSSLSVFGRPINDVQGLSQAPIIVSTTTEKGIVEQEEVTTTAAGNTFITGGSSSGERISDNVKGLLQEPTMMSTTTTTTTGQGIAFGNRFLICVPDPSIFGRFGLSNNDVVDDDDDDDDCLIPTIANNNSNNNNNSNRYSNTNTSMPTSMSTSSSSSFCYRPPPKKKHNTNTMLRVSVSSKTLDLFDQPFMMEEESEYEDGDNDDDDDDNDNANANANANVVKPVELISKETKETYMMETLSSRMLNFNIQEQAIIDELEHLSIQDQDQIMFEVHGLVPSHSTRTTASMMAANMMAANMDNNTNTNKNQKERVKASEQPQNDDTYLKKLNDELLLLMMQSNTATATATATATTTGAAYNTTTSESGNNNVNNNDDCNTDYYNTDAFCEAQRMNPNYVNSRKFRIMFLRMFSSSRNSDDNQYYAVPKAAARKMIKYFTIKKYLFGNSNNCEVLGRDVRLSDLSKDDREVLYSGAFQILNERDVAGRCIFLSALGQRPRNKHIDVVCRSLWYLLSQIMIDEENQLSGCVTIIHAKGYIPTNERLTFEENQKFINVWDAIIGDTVVATHYCYNDMSMKPFVTAHKVHFLSRYQRSRFREHYSKDHNDICFRLETYGIPIDKQLFKPNGQLGLIWYKEWINYRESQEKEDEENYKQQLLRQLGKSRDDNTDGDDDDATTTPRITTPTTVTILPKKFDVLFGKGNIRHHVGNLHCAYLVEQHQEEYENVNRREKTRVAEKIVQTIKKNDGRFLKMDRKKGWKEVGDDQAREKVSHFFRRLRKTT